MIYSEKMYGLGSKRSAIRELFEYGKKQAAMIGAENVFDFSLGNPTVPSPDIVNETLKEIMDNNDSITVHGYTSAQGDYETRDAIAKYLNNTYATSFNADNFYMTMGAAASLSLCFKALTTSGDDEFITIAPFFPEYNVFVQSAGAKLTVVSPDTDDFQINFKELEEKIDESLQNDQRKFILKEKMKVLKQELGEDSWKKEEVIEYRKVLDKLKIDKKIKDHFSHEIDKYEII